ncbi:MAG: rhodanese-like domain-containing protein, partial [Nitrososphaerales archaeon]
MGLVDALKKALARMGTTSVSGDGHVEGTKEESAGADLRVREVTAGELLAEMKQDAHQPLLLDIREPYERAQGFIPNSLNIAMNSVPYRLGELDP